MFPPAHLLLALMMLSVADPARFGANVVRPHPSHCKNELLPERERATSRGLDWLQRFLDDDRHLACIGEDAVEIFLEVGTSAPTASVRQRCLVVARRYATKLLPHYLEEGALQNHLNLEAAWALVARSDELHLQMDDLVARLADRMHSLGTFSEEYDVAASDVTTVGDLDLTMVVVDAYLLEKLRLSHPEIPSILRLRELLALLDDPTLWQRATKNEEIREELGYVATHAYFALNDYGRLRVRPGEAPVVWTFMQKELPEAIAQDELELVAEFLDVFHSAGLSESRDEEMCKAARLLLESQNPDGSWGTEGDDCYDTIHPTWTAVDALRAREFLRGTAFERRRASLVGKTRDHD